MSNGGPAPESITDAIFAKTKEITQYATCDVGEVCYDNILEVSKRILTRS